MPRVSYKGERGNGGERERGDGYGERNTLRTCGAADTGYNEQGGGEGGEGYGERMVVTYVGRNSVAQTYRATM